MTGGPSRTAETGPIGFENIKSSKILFFLHYKSSYTLTARYLEIGVKMKWLLRKMVFRVPCTACWRCGAAAGIGKKCLRCTAQN
jgi:hypothetical protein